MNALQYATDALKAYDSKPDCFKDAARALRQGCKGIDVDEDEKTRYELRSLQRNLSRTHSDQIRLLNEHQRVLKEINRLETKHRKQLSDLHSTIAAEVNSMLNSAGTLKDALRSVTEEVSKLTQSLERGALQQSEALSTTQESNARILAEYQNIVHSTLASISQSMRHWDDSLERGLSRVQEIDRLNQVSIAKIAHSNEAIDSITRQAAILKVHLQNLTHLSHESTTHLLDLHVTGTQNIDISTQQLLHSTLQSLQTLSSQTHTTWSSILDKFKDDTEITMTEFRTDVAEAMKETVEEIEQVAKESTENVERLSGDLEEFWRNQENALGRVRPLLGTWDIVRRVLESQSVMIEGGVVRGGGGLMVSRMGDLRKAQKDDAVEQEQEKEYEYGVGDEYEDGVYKDEYAKSYLDMDSAEERDVWQQPDDDILERRAAVRYNKFTSPSTPAPSTVKPKRQYQYRSLSINHKPLTKPSVDMDMDMWERVAASWDLGLGTCVSSSSTKGDIY
ncbi:hypothetical protein EC957_008737 [Mortierella hygrophila]|uniref:Uncharacterized protein n=1 Tax=Mortierella hygrophila TaxID=979708 RepID=A0A9P6FBV9_9FUNG|nr:hypothetical protein EC957_008737 [Mortierella hygrophila]